MALGASRAAVLQAVMARGLVLAVAGVAIGTPLALVLARLVSSLIYGVNAWDAATFICVPLALAAIALTASYVPALRATRVDPLVALHYE
jgi:ABC-type antimicrobial peptide transport system permease subunit